MFVCDLKLSQKTPIIYLIQSGMVLEGTRGQNMRRKTGFVIYRKYMNTVLFVNTTIGFSENLFLVIIMIIIIIICDATCQNQALLAI